MKSYFKEHKKQDCSKGVFSDLRLNKRWCKSAKEINFGTESTHILIYT